MALLVVAFLWIAFGTTEYRVLAPCRIVSENVNTVAAPLDGRIESVLVQPGQRVKQGQLLIRFDRSDLLNERNRILTQIASTKIETNALLQQRQPQEAFQMQSRLALLNTQRQLIDERLQRGELYAEMDGVILPTEIHRRVGQYVELGEPLLELADEQTWHLEIETPEDEIRHVAINQPVHFQSRARPDCHLNCRITRISPSSQIVSNSNVVLTRAKMQARPDWMKIGMEGHVRIETGRQPVWLGLSASGHSMV